MIFLFYRNNNIPKIPEEYNNLMLTWSLFCKETLPDRTFTFWEWFYRILLLTSHNMGRLWKEGYIMGFVMKQAAEKMLEQQQNGCFLLRFSDSELGGVTIAYVRKQEFRKYINKRVLMGKADFLYTNTSCRYLTSSSLLNFRATKCPIALPIHIP